MDNPFFGGYSGRVPERRSYQRPNYYYPDPYAATSYDTPVKSENAHKVKPKNVVSIPVHFANSETPKSRKAPAMDENTAAQKIQVAFRGFCVRKLRPLNKLRVITKTKAETAEIRKRVNDEHVVELIRRDEKERMKMTEWIMLLLLRLDEIQGTIPFVRESRKAVIREVVNLQETVDNIIATKSRQEDAGKEIPVISEAAMEECPTVEENSSARFLQENLHEEFKSELLRGDAIEVFVNNEKGEESPPSQIICKEEGDIVGNSRDGENSFESLDFLKVQTLQSDVKLEIADFMDYEEGGDKLSEKVKSIEDIGMVREDNEKLKRMVSELLKEIEKQSEMIDDLSFRVSQLETKSKRAGDGKKKSGTPTEKRGGQTNNSRRKSNKHSSNFFMEDWF